MTLRLNNLRIEAAKPRPLAQFWMRALNWTLVHGTPDAVVIAPTSIRPIPADYLALLFVAGRPEQFGRSRMVFDLAPTDRDAEIRRLEQLGASRIDVDPGDHRWVMMADPEGNQFCVLHPAGQLPVKKATP